MLPGLIAVVYGVRDRKAKTVGGASHTGLVGPDDRLDSHVGSGAGAPEAGVVVLHEVVCIVPGSWFTAVLLVFGWFLSGGDTPDYIATDKDWTDWARDNRVRSGIGAFLVLLAGIALLHFAGTIRSVLGGAETTVPGSAQLARVAFAGAVVGAAGIATAIVMVGAATSEGADADPVVSRAVTTASAGPTSSPRWALPRCSAPLDYLTLQSGVFPRWTGIVARR